MQRMMRGAWIALLAAVLAAGTSVAIAVPAAAHHRPNHSNGGGEAPGNDSDGDGVEDGADNCLDDYNPDQSDSDGDGTGDACDEPNGEPVQRVPPYDFGCVGGDPVLTSSDSPCTVDSERAEQGVLDAVDVPFVCTYYTFPPTFYPCRSTTSTATGVHVGDVDPPSSITATATVRDLSEVDVRQLRLWACLSMFTVRDGRRYSIWSSPCRPVSSSTTITSTFEVNSLPGQWGLYVSLSEEGSRGGGPLTDPIGFVTPPMRTGSAVVESISYEVSAIVVDEAEGSTSTTAAR